MRITAAVLILALSLATRPAAAGDWRGSTNVVDGVAHVMNPADPMQEPATLAGAELWRIGGDDEDDVFGLIGDILVDDAGSTYILDRQMMSVLVYSDTGEFVRSFGREGEGPGEFRMPGGIFLLPGGGLGVVQMMPPRIVAFDRDGNALSDIGHASGEGMSMVTRVVAGGDVLFIEEQTSSFDKGAITMRQSVRRAGIDGEGGETLWETTHKVDIQNMTLGSGTEDVPVWEVAADGRLYVSRGYNEYSIEAYDPTGHLGRVIGRDYEKRRRTDDEIAKQRAQLEKMKLPVGKPHIEIYPTDRDIVQMTARGDELWVMSSRSFLRGDEPGVGAFEVFDADGRYVRNVVLSVEFVRDRDIWYLRGNSLFVVENGVGAVQATASQVFGNADEEPTEDMGPPELIRYRIGNALE